MNPEFLDIIGRSLQAIGWVFLPFLLTPLLCLLFPKSKFITSFQSALSLTIDGFNLWVGEAVKWLVPALVVTVAFGVIALSIFGQAWTKYDESATYFHAIVILLGSAATLLAGQHVRVDIFHSKMQPKSKALVDFTGFYALLIPFCIILLWNAQSFVGLSWVSLEGSAESDGIRGVFILKTFVSIFALMMLAQGLSIAGRAALLIGGADPQNIQSEVEEPFEIEHLESGL
ncbi:MAG: TRAP transporter small permease subunit [Robiginitomaculum sp.]|nr:TRAP transporter small permease subunit [Robiginitomaculum sp.]